MRSSIIVFDLDGTLVDSAAGIRQAFHLTLDEWGREASDDVLGTLIGPPLHDSFARLGFLPDEIDDVVARYRQHYDVVGPPGCRPYPGVEGLLTRAASVAPIALASAKREDFARRILAEWALSDHFVAIVGAPHDGRRVDKSALLETALQRAGLVAPTGWMVGDRRFDVEAGRHVGLRTLGVLWGYGTRGELVDAGVDALAASPSEAADRLVAAFAR